MNTLIAWVLKLVFTVGAMIFTASLLVVLVGVIVATSLWSVLQGRKPQVAVLWTRYRDLTKGMTQTRSWSQAQSGSFQSQSAKGDIVDVPVKEIFETRTRLTGKD
jgi:hypothetical protein